jgi:putative transcriptional regulator
MASVSQMKNTVRRHRDGAGMSQADLAAAVDVTRQTINAVERERYDPVAFRLFKTGVSR